MKSLKLISCIFLLTFLSCSKPFDKEIWKKEKYNNLTTKSNLRSKMVKDLIENYLEIGQSKEHISNLLGKPIESDKNNQNKLKYLLGPTLGDFEFLILTFSEENELIDYEIKKT